MEKLSRRSFLKGSVIAGLATTGAIGISGCSPKTQETTNAQDSSAVDWLGEAPVIEEDKIKSTVDVDVLVCGVGTAGIVGAAKAAFLGMKVLAIDHGNHSSIKSAVGSINNRRQVEAGVTFDKHEIMNDMERYSISGTDRRVLDAWAERSGEAVDFLCDCMEAAGLSVIPNTAKSYPQTFHKPWLIEMGTPDDIPMEEAMSSGDVTPNYLIEQISERGGEVRYQTKLIKLEQDKSGAVVGAIIRNSDNSYARVNAAKGVILSAGGYAGNLDMLRALQPETIDMIANFQMNTDVPGDGIKAGLWAGGMMQDSHCGMVFDRAALPVNCEGGEDYLYDGAYFSLSSQPWLKVNLNGERFMNESALYESAPRAALNQPGHCYCVIYDSNWQEQSPKNETHGCSRFYSYPDAHITSAGNIMSVQAMMDEFLADGRVVQANTLTELAKGLGIPADTFEKTVARYNELCAAGVDEDFGKEAFRMQPLTAPPYYGFRCAGNLLCTLDGLIVSPKSEVLNEDFEPIPGLYAAGNDAGGFYANCYPSLMIGLNAGRSITQSFIAAEELSKR